MNDAPSDLTALQAELHTLRQRVAELEAQLTTTEARATETITTGTDTKAALHQSEERWQLAAWGTNESIWDWNVQTDEVYLSPRWIEMLGFAQQELGPTFRECCNLVHPDDLALVMQAINDHLAGRTEYYSAEFRARCKDGSYIWILDHGKALRDRTGTAIRLVGSRTDISARKRAEDWLQSLIDTTQDAVISIDRQGRIIRFNPSAERMFGYSKAEVEGQQVSMLMPKPYAAEHDGYITRYEQTRESHAIGRIRTVTAQRKNKELFPIELSVTEIQTDDEEHYAAFIRDISEKVRLQEKAVENERLAAIGVTAAKLAHEIGNPLNGMAMSAQLLERRLASTNSDDKSIERVRGLRDQLARLTQLLQEFRNLLRRQDYCLVPTNLSQLVTHVLTAETENYVARGVTLVHDSAPGLPLVKADAAKLSQVLVNLCKNAVEAMSNGGTLTVRVQHDGHKQVQLHVTDTGSGIPDGVNIFEPFITTKPEGIGLGLPVVRQIVAAHGGTLTYRSAPGQGTTFTVTLTAMDEATHSPPDTRTSIPRTEEAYISLCELCAIA